MDEAFKKSEIEVTANKVWDSQRAYEKKVSRSVFLLLLSFHFFFSFFFSPLGKT